MNFKVCPKSQGRSNLVASVPKWECQLSGYDMPRNVDPSVKKGVGLKQLAYCTVIARVYSIHAFLTI